MRQARFTNKSAPDKPAASKPGHPVRVDPLYIIFEQHLFNFQDQDMDRKTLVLKIVNEYLSYLRRKNISVPRGLEQPVMEELARQVNTMIVKKIYGCLTIEDYQRGVEPTQKRRARTRYSRLGMSKSK